MQGLAPSQEQYSAPAVKTAAWRKSAAVFRWALNWRLIMLCSSCLELSAAPGGPAPPGRALPDNLRTALSAFTLDNGMQVT